MANTVKRYNFWRNIGESHYRIQSYDKAIKPFLKALKIKESTYPILNVIGRFYKKNGDLNSAIKQYKIATNIFPKKKDAWLDWGFLLFTIQRLEEAKEKSEKAVMLGSVDFGNMNLGHVEWCLGNKEKAIQHYQTALQHFGNKEEFFAGMEEDYQYIAPYGISEVAYQEVIVELRAL